MNSFYIPELFTKTSNRVTLYQFSKYSFCKRYSLALRKDLNAEILVLVLNDYFPGIAFIPKNSNGNISILRYIIQKHGKWTLDIYAMSKSGEKIFSNLFPEDISRWDETEARKKYGCADVIRFFIDIENEIFSQAVKNRGKNIPCRFIKELDYSGKSVWENWDFSVLVIHKMRRRPPSIYEAFGYYAHRLYTLLNFGLASGNNTDDELIKTGIKLLNDTIQEQIPISVSFSFDRLTEFFEMIQETLESVPAGGSIYTPTELDVFISQLKGRIANLYKTFNSVKEEETYNASDRKTINNHIEKVRKIFTNSEILSELKKIGFSGTYREKISLLHRIIFANIPQEYSKRELNIIHSLFLKQQKSISLDRQFDDSEDGGLTGYDLIGDDKFTTVEDHLVWSSFFRNEFAEELDRDSLEKFIECLPDHFSRYPFDVDSEGNLSISKYSRKILFSTFCLVADITPDNELWKPFLVLLQRTIENINKSRRM
jgi:hypothetical protein